jgi:hypothetical protein
MTDNEGGREVVIIRDSASIGVPGSGYIVQGRMAAQGRYIRGRIVMGSADGVGRLVFPL